MLNIVLLEQFPIQAKCFLNDGMFYFRDVDSNQIFDLIIAGDEECRDRNVCVCQCAMFDVRLFCLYYPILSRIRRILITFRNLDYMRPHLLY